MQKKAKAKIDKGIDSLKIQNKDIIYYSIAKAGRVSYNTVKKYISDDDLVSLNKDVKN